MSLKGALSRWLVEPNSGVFLGNPTARVRDLLWRMAVEKCRNGTVVQIWSHRGPQGYKFRTHNLKKCEFVDFEGMALVRWPHAAKKEENTGIDGSLTTK